MKKFWRILLKVLIVSFGLCCAALFIVVLTSAIHKQKSLVCRSIQVKIDYDAGFAFLAENEIKSKINLLVQGEIKGKTLSGIDFRMLEREIRQNPYVKNAEVYVDQEQDIVVEIIQKRPVLRVINNDGVSYYLSETNDRIPLCNNFTTQLVIALGNVELHQDTKRDSIVQAALFHLSQFIAKDEFLAALVDQVYVHENGEMDIIPKIPGHIIHFGIAEQDMAGKFERLKIFYTEGLARVGWTKYKSLDLRYENQVVCEKRDSTNKL